MEYKGYRYITEADDDGDVIKLYHFAADSDGDFVSIDFSPYQRMTEEDFKKWVDEREAG